MLLVQQTHTWENHTTWWWGCILNSGSFTSTEFTHVLIFKTVYMLHCFFQPLPYFLISFRVKPSSFHISWLQGVYCHFPFKPNITFISSFNLYFQRQWLSPSLLLNQIIILDLSSLKNLFLLESPFLDPRTPLRLGFFYPFLSISSQISHPLNS